jgi:hypothetical protein
MFAKIVNAICYVEGRPSAGTPSVLLEILRGPPESLGHAVA